MAAYTFPPTLPVNVEADGYSETSGVLVLVSPMDAGVAKMRRRGFKPKQFSVTFVMDDTQIATLETFIQTTLKGTARFDFPHPRTGATIEVRIVPTGDGQYFTASYYTPTRYKVSMNLEQMP